MGLRGDAAIVGIAEHKAQKIAEAPRQFHLEQVGELTRMALQDAGLPASAVDGLILPAPHFNEARSFIPALCAEYLGLKLNFAEVIDLGGAAPVGMAWRAAMAIELGMAQTVVCVSYARRPPPVPGAADPAIGMRLGASSANFGAPEAEFDLPYGHVAQNSGYAMVAQRYGATYGYDPRAMAKIVVDQRVNACANPNAIFYGQKLTIDDVLASKMIADPLHILEIVMPVAGGAAIVITKRHIAQSLKNRPAFIKGCGERLEVKSPSYATEMLDTPVGPAARRAFAMAGLKPADMHMAQLYDCYTITVLLTLEDAGFCKKGAGAAFLRDHDLTFRGDFPVNTHGGQLGFGQAGGAGGMSQVVEAARQIMGRAGARQLQRHDLAFVSGTGGVMSEQSALILAGEG
jgi:acetyl-CoA acetyltransferase